MAIWFFFHSNNYKFEDIAFFPSKDTVDTKFLSQSYFNGYRIWDENIQKGIMYLKDRAFNYAYQPLYQKDNASLTADTLSIIPVTVRFYLGDLPYLSQHGDEKSTILYEFENKRQELQYNVHDYRNILLISVLRNSDRKWLNENYQHYIPSR